MSNPKARRIPHAYRDLGRDLATLEFLTKKTIRYACASARRTWRGHDPTTDTNGGKS